MREKSTQTKRKRKVSKRVKRNRAIAFLLLIGLLFGSFYMLTNSAGKIRIPSLVGWFLCFHLLGRKQLLSSANAQPHFSVVGTCCLCWWLILFLGNAILNWMHN